MTGRHPLPTAVNDARLTQPELAAIYRRLNPDQVYLGDPPEKWFAGVLLTQIRHRLTESS